MVKELLLRTPLINTGAEILVSVNLRSLCHWPSTSEHQQASAPDAGVGIRGDILLLFIVAQCRRVTPSRKGFSLLGCENLWSVVFGVLQNVLLLALRSEGDFPSTAWCHLLWEQKHLPAVIRRHLAGKDNKD